MARHSGRVSPASFLNPSGQIGIGLTTVTSPGGTPVHVDVSLTLPSLNGTWTDDAGNSGAFVFTPGAGTGGTPRPVSVPATLYNVFANPTIDFVGIGRSTRISSNEVFGVSRTTVANDYGGMYVETSHANGWPFYGYATNGSFRAWTYYDGTTGAWRLYNAGVRMTVENEGHVVIGSDNDPASPALGAKLEFRGSGPTDFVRAYDAGNALKFKIDGAGNVAADGSYTSPAADFAELLPAEAGVSPGDVLVIGPDGQLQRSSEPFQSGVAGVHSTTPAFLGGSRGDVDEPGQGAARHRGRRAGQREPGKRPDQSR